MSHALKFGELMSTGENEWEEMTDMLCRETKGIVFYTTLSINYIVSVD